MLLSESMHQAELSLLIKRHIKSVVFIILVADEANVLLPLLLEHLSMMQVIVRPCESAINAVGSVLKKMGMIAAHSAVILY